MAPSNVDYQSSGEVESYTHKKFKSTNYMHKKFGKKSSKEVAPATLFRPYALNENTPRKRRLGQQQQQQQQHHQQHHQLPPTPPTTPPQQQYQPYQVTPTPTPSPAFNHQAYAYMLQKQRTVLQMRQLLSINPDANTWPIEWRQALQTLLQQ